MLAVTRRWQSAWQQSTWTDLAWLLAAVLLFWAGKSAAKVIDGLPGHAGAFWIPSLLMARATVSRPGSATLAAGLGALAWDLPRGNGFGGVAQYLAAGLLLDAFVSDGARLRRVLPALAAGIGCHLAKFVVHNVPAAVLGLHADFLRWGLLATALLHMGFGAVGGLGGWLLLRGKRER